MDDRESIKTILLTSYTSESAFLIQKLIDEGSALEEVIFMCGEKRRLSWRSRLANLQKIGKFNEPKRILANNKIAYSFTDNHNNPDIVQKLKGSGVELILLYGTKLICEEILSIPSIGTLNAHSALLPKYRGTKVEFWMLYNNEPEYAGVTIHWVTPGLDEGDIFLQEPLEVDKDETPLSLRQKSVPLAGKLFSQAIQMIQDGKIIKIPQDSNLATKVKRPSKEMIKEYYARK